MDATTLLRRTPLGGAELAAPSHGLSLTQRRILTLLDTPACIGAIAARLSFDQERLERDIARLEQSGLVHPERTTDDLTQRTEALAPVRLGAPRLIRKIPVVMLVGVAAVGVWVGWQYAVPRAPSESNRTHAGATPAGADAQSSSSAADPAAIATRVLRGDVTDRARDAARAGTPGPHAPAPLTSPERAASNPAATAPIVSDRAATIEPSTIHGVAAGSFATMAEQAEHDSRNSGDVVAATRGSPVPHDESAPDGSVIAVSAVAAPATAAASTTTTTQAEPTTLQSNVAAPSTSQPANAAPPTLSAPPPASAPGETASAREPASATAAPMQLASLVPPATAVRAIAPVTLVPVAREAPEFPREAIAQGVQTGTVKARLTIDAQGKVSGVDILDAAPRRVFDRAVRDALSRWQFQPGAAGRSTTVDVAFKRD